MNWRWLILDFIPPEFELTRAQRRHVRTCARHLPHAKLIFASKLLFSAIVEIFWFYAIVAILISIVLGILPRLYIVATFAVLIAGWLIWIGLMAAFYRPFVLRALELYLHDRCGACDYDLSGLDETILMCPECGRARHIVSPVTLCSTCSACGYFLTGLPYEITCCPECGTVIVNANPA